MGITVRSFLPALIVFDHSGSEMSGVGMPSRYVGVDRSRRD